MNFNNISSEERKEWIETFIGGACGVVAIIAAIAEYVLGDNGAIAGMFKDIFGTLVVVVLLFAAMPKRKPKDLAAILEERVEKWGLSNAPLIFKAENYQSATGTNYAQGLSRTSVFPGTEADLEKTAIEEISKTDAPVFILQAATNIDRLVTAYTRPLSSIQPFLADRLMRSSNIPYSILASAEMFQNLSLVNNTFGTR